MDKVIIGIDVSKDRLDVAVRPSGEAFAVERNVGGLKALIARLKTLEPHMVALEATGGFETVVAVSLGAAGLPFAVVNPAQIRAFAKALGKRAKTDPIDAAVIAHFAEAAGPEPRPLPDEATQLLADLIARRRQIIAMIVAERQREKRAQAKSLKKSIARLIKALEKELTSLDGEIWRHSRLAGLAGEGGSARLRAWRRRDHRAHADRHLAGVGNAGSPGNRRAGRPCALDTPVRPVARQKLHRWR
jgi:transposase